MLEFITLISLLCSQHGVGHGNSYSNSLEASPVSIATRKEAFAAQSACTKRLFKACTEKHKITGTLLSKKAECLVENL